ncbi:MAG: diaminopimelate epimerase [Bacteroidales bacterium]|nr:diaminopimelate epimerase [Bacteroidales bacterium]
MILPFHKLHGTGNDFILIDNRKHYFQKYTNHEQLIKLLCDRHFGIGADGLILINKKPFFDFEMVYFNADGKEGTLCGNGSRCAVAFANELNLCRKDVRFFANDQTFFATILKKRKENIFVSLKMQDLMSFEKQRHYVLLDTGSPHYVCFYKDVTSLNVFEEGRKIRNSSIFRDKGVNVNFVELFDDHIFVRTYERGVENETLSCGTGVVASALSCHIFDHFAADTVVDVKTLGGNLKVSYSFENGIYKNIFLEGPATFVFYGEVEI